MNLKCVLVEEELPFTAKLSMSSLLKLNIQPGDYIEVIGSRICYLTVLKSTSLKDIEIGLDQKTFDNLRVNPGSLVKVNKVSDLQKAKKIVLVERNSKPTDTHFVLKKFKGVAVVKNNFLQFEDRILDVLSTEPYGPGIITDSTEIVLKSRKKNNFEGVLYDDIGGLSKQLQEIRDIIELQLLHPELYSKLGVKATKGILLYGPPGTGKTLLAKAIATETSAFFISINAPEMMSKYVGESEENLRKVFKLARENSPSVVFIDEIDAITPKRDESSEAQQRFVAQLLTLLDGLEQNTGIVVIGATNRRDSIDEALRRPGRFDREIEIPIPDEPARQEIFQIHTRAMPLSQDVDLKKLSSMTYGFTGADIEALCKEAAMNCLRRVMRDSPKGMVEIHVLNSLQVNMNDFLAALKSVEPSALREVIRELPKASWEDIGGMHNIKQELQEIVRLKLLEPEKLSSFSISLPRGILLEGPSGTGKTLIARALYSSALANFIYISMPSLLSKYVGESEKNIRQIFGKARNAAPCIVFIDSLESLTKRNQTLTRQIAIEMDNLPDNVLVIGTTTQKKKIDPILVSEGRFEKVIEIPLPNDAEREEIINIYLKKLPVDPSVLAREISKHTEGFTPSKLRNLCMQAATFCLRRNGSLISYEDFSKALNIDLNQKTMSKSNSSKEPTFYVLREKKPKDSAQ